MVYNNFRNSKQNLATICFETTRQHPHLIQIWQVFRQLSIATKVAITRAPAIDRVSHKYTSRFRANRRAPNRLIVHARWRLRYRSVRLAERHSTIWSDRARSYFEAAMQERVRRALERKDAARFVVLGATTSRCFPPARRRKSNSACLDATFLLDLPSRSFVSRAGLAAFLSTRLLTVLRHFRDLPVPLAPRTCYATDGLGDRGFRFYLKPGLLIYI